MVFETYTIYYNVYNVIMVFVVVLVVIVGCVLFLFYLQKSYLIMDRSWIKVNRLSKEYENKVIQFFDFAGKNLPKEKGIFLCPFKFC